jgi:hypothetical protein
MTVWIMRRLQNPFCSGLILFRTATAASAGSIGRHQIIVEPTCAREGARLH